MTKTKPLKQRDFRLDNFKAILIILVVLGHVLELKLDTPINLAVYKTIYLFHMPAFVFITGYFAKNRFDKLKTDLRIYIIFQILYSVFVFLVLKINVFGGLLTTPYWIMWFLLAKIIWTILIPIFDENQIDRQLIWLGVAVVLSLLIGYSSNVGYKFSLARVVTLLPFFLAGYYQAHYQLLSNIWQKLKTNNFLILVIGLTIVGLIVYIIGFYRGSVTCMYGASSYLISGCGIKFRAAWLSVAAGAIFVFLSQLPNRSWGILTKLGQKTLLIYLLHGFLLRPLIKIEVLRSRINIVVAVFLTTLIISLICWLESAYFRKLQEYIYRQVGFSLITQF